MEPAPQEVWNATLTTGDRQSNSPPALPITERARGSVASTRFTRAAKSALEEAAQARRRTALSEWSREVFLREARRKYHDALFTEMIATRMLLVNLIKPLSLGEKVSPAWITEAMTMVRNEKHQAAQEVMQQYTQQAGKE